MSVDYRCYHRLYVLYAGIIPIYPVRKVHNYVAKGSQENQKVNQMYEVSVVLGKVSCDFCRISDLQT